MAGFADAGLLTILFALAALAHAVVGLRSVLVDYVHRRARLVAAVLLVRGAAVILAGASVLAVLKLFLGR
jgi:succinate dehydrogenase / fumarate reductase membrane anchor subunit